MFIYLSKLLPPLLYPLGLVCLLLVVALLTHRWARVQRAILVIGLLVLWLSSTRFVAYPLTYWLETRYRTPAELQRGAVETGLKEPVAPVIVVLGGDIGPADPPRQLPEMGGATTARLIYAAYLYKHGAAPRILLSCGTTDFLGDHGTPTADMRFLLRQLDVPDSVILSEDQSRNTHENAVFSQRLLAAKGIQKVILVTSASHLPRAVALFRKANLEVIPAPADISVTRADLATLVSRHPVTQLLNLLPSPANLYQTTMALKECLGLIVYRARGWI